MAFPVQASSQKCQVSILCEWPAPPFTAHQRRQRQVSGFTLPSNDAHTLRKSRGHLVVIWRRRGLPGRRRAKTSLTTSNAGRLDPLTVAQEEELKLRRWEGHGKRFSSLLLPPRRLLPESRRLEMSRTLIWWRLKSPRLQPLTKFPSLRQHFNDPNPIETWRLKK